MIVVEGDERRRRGRRHRHVQGATSSMVFVALLAASRAHASDVDMLGGFVFGLFAIMLLPPLLALVPVAAVAGLCAFVEGRTALGAQALLLSAATVGATFLMFNHGTEGPGATVASLVTIASALVATWVILVRGMVRHWSSTKRATGALVGGAIWAVGFVGATAALLG